MRIYSMTATFGKLNNETLTLQEGLNIIQRPNEWGKTTWGAFLVAMLYGINTREQSKTGVLADKDRYRPWSGQPMAGRIELQWNGQDITIERSTKRNPLSEFRAYYTASGLPVRELTADNCGLQLLGVEKEVFMRSGFVRLKDMPVTSDDTLRRRLNSLVTTGDENNACDHLEDQLREYKNSCYLNRSKGLLPQVQAQEAELEQKLHAIEELQILIRNTQQRQESAEAELSALQNHMNALKYEANRTFHEKLSAAQAALAAAQAQLHQAEAACEGLPELAPMQQKLSYLQSLGEQRAALQLKLSMLPPPPQLPQVPAPFVGATPDTAMEQTQADFNSYTGLSVKAKKKGLLLAGISAAVLGIAAAFLPWQAAIYAGIGLALLGVIALVIHFIQTGKLKGRCADLQAKYAGLSPDQWLAAAQTYVAAQTAYMQQSQEHQAKREALLQQAELLEQTILQSTEGASLTEKQQSYQADIGRLQQLADAKKEAARCDDLVLALQSSYQEVPPPCQPDTLSLSEEETSHRITALQMEQKQLQLKLGQFQGQAESLGQSEHIRAELEQVCQRIVKLQTYYKALQYALEQLEDAKRKLQSRFAPQISSRAQALMRQMTDGRYDRLTLEHDLTILAATTDEPSTSKALCRSDGTMDQLYFALRLSVSESLLPDVPLILDDALVRFDDQRLQAALQLLQQTAQDKQVILFTCQDREKRILGI